MPGHDMIEMLRGRYRLRLGRAPALATRALGVRAWHFPPDRHGPDAIDAQAHHGVVELCDGGAPVAAFRVLPLDHGQEVGTSYAARSYDMAALARFPAPMIEIGRFCVAPAAGDADILRLAWAGIASMVDRADARMLFGCASFAGTDPARHARVFAWLSTHHTGPDTWRPRQGGGPVHRFADSVDGPSDPRAALRDMPSLLRSYLAMGGWTSDHAVIDPEMGTMHVFTAVEIASIPPARARALRAVASDA